MVDVISFSYFLVYSFFFSTRSEQQLYEAALQLDLTLLCDKYNFPFFVVLSSVV